MDIPRQSAASSRKMPIFSWKNFSRPHRFGSAGTISMSGDCVRLPMNRELLAPQVESTAVHRSGQPTIPSTVNALLDPAKLKWKDLVTPGTPIPTPWPKNDFERFESEIQKQRRELRAAGKSESEMEELFRKEREKEDAMFAAHEYAHRIGAFEGANYQAKGYFRSQMNCIMFTRHDAFCAVC